MEGTSIAESDVMEYLQKHYQEADLGWVSGCHWVSDNVLLSDIDWEDRPGGIDEDKVSDKVKKLEKSQPHPVVLVAPDPESKMRVADGYHRCAALSQSGQSSVSAWIGVPKHDNVGWMADVEQMQFTAKNHDPGE